MIKVFISYKSEQKKIATDIHNYLKRKGMDSFLADRSVEMRGNSDYQAFLVRKIDEADAFLFLHCDEANKNPKHVHQELVLAFDKDPSRIIAVRLDESEIGDEFRYILAGHDCIPFSTSPLCSSFSLKKIEKAIRRTAESQDLTSPNEEQTDKQEEDEKNTVLFEYRPDVGIMVNPADSVRNVSFRTDTFINMMGGIYEKITSTDGEEVAQNIFFQNGFECGKNFATQMNSKLGSGSSVAEMKEKVQKWCEFDSQVGWGKFEANLDIDVQRETIGGNLTITEAFIIDTEKERKVCAFIRGYCTAVLNTLLGHLDVELICKECRLKNKLRNQCVFEVKLKK